MTQGHKLALSSPSGLLTLSGGIPSFPEVLSLSVTGTTKSMRLFSLLSDRAAFSPWVTTCLIPIQEAEEHNVKKAKFVLKTPAVSHNPCS